jgi:hypothetical protein
VADPLHRGHDEGDREADEAGPHVRDGRPETLVRLELGHVNVEHEQRDDNGVNPVGQRQHARGIPAPLVPGQAAARTELVAFPHESRLATQAPGCREAKSVLPRNPGGTRTRSRAQPVYSEVISAAGPALGSALQSIP